MVQTQTQQPTSNFTTHKTTLATSELYPITNPHNNHFYIKFVPKPTVPRKTPPKKKKKPGKDEPRKTRQKKSQITILSN